MTNLKLLKILGLLEGVSLLLLLFVCTPLKYLADLPQPTKYIGMAHGVLFMAYCLWVIIVGMEKKWKLKVILLCLLASIIPFGTFWADKKYFKD